MMEHDHRPVSGRRLRPSERPLSGIHAAVAWPKLEARRRSVSPCADSGAATLATSAGGVGLVPSTTSLPALVPAADLPQSPPGPAERASQSDSPVDNSSGHNFAALTWVSEDSAGLTADNVAALNAATDADKAIYAASQQGMEENGQEDDWVTQGEGQGRSLVSPSLSDAPTVRRRYFSDLKGPSEPRAFEIVMTGTEQDSNPRDYLTWYYTDFISEAADTPNGWQLPAGGPPFSEDNTTSPDELFAWLKEFKPRTRIDAYPMLQVAVVALEKLMHREVKLRSQQTETLIKLNWDLEKTVERRDSTIHKLSGQVAFLQSKKSQLEKDFAIVNASFEEQMSETNGLRDAATVPGSESGKPTNIFELMTEMRNDLASEKTRYQALEATLYGKTRQALEATTRNSALEKELSDANKQIDRLQAYAKKQELQKFALQDQARQNKTNAVFARLLRMNLSSFWKVWMNVVNTNRGSRQGRQKQIDRMLCTFDRRRARTLLRVFCERFLVNCHHRMLIARKTKTVRNLARIHILSGCLTLWGEFLARAKMGKILMLVGQKKQDNNSTLVRAALRGWRQAHTYFQGLRRAVVLLTSDRDRKMVEVIRQIIGAWKVFASSSLLSKAGFGSKQSLPLHRTGSTGSNTSGPKLTRSSSFGSTGSNTFGPKLTRSSSFRNSCEEQPPDLERVVATRESLARLSTPKARHEGRGQMTMRHPKVGRTQSPNFSGPPSRTGSMASIHSILEMDPSPDEIGRRSDGGSDVASIVESCQSPTSSFGRRESADTLSSPQPVRSGASSVRGVSITEAERARARSMMIGAQQGSFARRPESTFVDRSQAQSSSNGSPSAVDRDRLSESGIEKDDSDAESVAEAARAGISQEAFLSALLRRGGADPI